MECAAAIIRLKIRCLSSDTPAIRTPSTDIFRDPTFGNAPSPWTINNLARLLSY
jgi:hypothetical protein